MGGRNAVRQALAQQGGRREHPPLRWWHRLALGVLIILALLGLRAPGLLSDIGGQVVGGWQAGSVLRVTLFLLSACALVGVRSYTPLKGLYLFGAAVFVTLRLAEGQVSEEPLTFAVAGLLCVLMIPAIRVIIRPNDAETVTERDQTIRRLRERLGESDDV